MALYERDLNAPHRPPPPPPAFNKTSPLPSKLPRRVATPPVTPAPRTPASKWVSSVAQRIASVEKSSATAKENASMTPQQSPQPERKPTSKPNDKPLPSQKPLPSRPIARLSNSLSPTKDSRCLIDASESPLHITSIAGEKHDWPALRPQSVSLTPKSALASSTSPSPATDTAAGDNFAADCATISAVTAATAALTDVLDRQTSSTSLPGELTSLSPQSSYASADENSPLDQAGSERLNKSKKSRRSTFSIRSPRKSVLSTGLPLNASPTRRISLRRPPSRASTHDTPVATSQKCTPSAEMIMDTPSSPNRSDSRLHSPSPASFSRPRPGSLSKSMKTASRIPIPDAKKATVIDVKKNRLSTSSLPKPMPSFGSRRLASPDALKVLENGKMRRQLKRTPTDASLQRNRAEHMWETESNATTCSFNTPSLSHSNGTSPEATVAASSPETSPFPPVGSAKICSRKTISIDEQPFVEQSTFEDSSCIEDGFETDGYFTDTSFTQAPPTTSPFTLPLQTIPSEAMLTAHEMQQYQRPYDELVRALSHLEGKGSPPKTDVDPQALLHMFGHVKRELEHYPLESAALAEHAAVAEKFLAKNPSLPTDQTVLPGGTTAVPDRNNVRNEKRWRHTAERNTMLVSKWSDSTPSDKALSPGDGGIALNQTHIPIKSRQSAARSRVSSNGTISIGYPSSRHFGFSNESAARPPPPNEVASPPTVYRRRSSPTLGGQNKPGSVRAAREGMKAATASFAHMTASAAAKKASRMPTPSTKLYDVPETQPRRRSSMRKSRARHVGGTSPKTPCSQSKGRFVLDKINGIFSGKRDRKSQEPPPLPYLVDSRARHSDLKTVKESGHSTPAMSSPEFNNLPKMPSLSPYSQVPLKRSFSNQSLTSDSGMEDGFGDSQSLGALSMCLLEKAKKEKHAQRKARLLNFAKVLNDALISVREAQISAETAQTAAKNAQVSYEMTLKSLAMLQKLAMPMAGSGHH